MIQRFILQPTVPELRESELSAFVELYASICLENEWLAQKFLAHNKASIALVIPSNCCCNSEESARNSVKIYSHPPHRPCCPACPAQRGPSHCTAPFQGSTVSGKLTTNQPSMATGCQREERTPRTQRSENIWWPKHGAKSWELFSLWTQMCVSFPWNRSLFPLPSVWQLQPVCRMSARTGLLLFLSQSARLHPYVRFGLITFTVISSIDPLKLKGFKIFYNQVLISGLEF